MGRPKVSYSDRELKQSRNFTAIVYPDSEDYDYHLILNRLSSFWDKFYYILHDKDCYLESDYEKWIADNKSDDVPFQPGELKKPHYHIVVSHNDPVILGRAAKKFGLSSNYVQTVHKLKPAVQYLIHLNNPEKFQYSPSDIVTSDSNISYLLNSELCSMDKARLIIDYINGCEHVTISKVASYCLQEGLWDELRRGQHIFSALINEKRGSSDAC